MRNRFERLNGILHYTGHLLEVLGLVLLLPAVVAVLHFHQRNKGWLTVNAFVLPAAFSVVVGFILKNTYRSEMLDTVSSMLMCAVGWLACSAVGAVPFVIGHQSSYLNAYFEAMSGFTTTGITVYTGLDAMPYSLLFWRALMQWFGGLGILSFFLIVTFRASSAHHIFGAESHKISSTRPAPGLFNTLKILWLIYAGFTLGAIVILMVLRMPAFDAVCHAFTALSTGGFSPHDASIDFYRQNGYAHYRLIEYVLTFFMMLGGINFLVHYRMLTGDVKALWDNIEIRYWWRLIVAFTVVVMLDHLHTTGLLSSILTSRTLPDGGQTESVFRHSLFQVMALLTGTGFKTQDIGSDFFGAASKQLFLVMMVIGGCAGSTSGGFKVLRVAMLSRLVQGQLFKAKVSSRTSTGLVIDKRLVPDAEIHRVAALFFAWIVLLVVGGIVTALCTNFGALPALSGMFSALGNVGPCYLSVPEIIALPPAVKITYIVGMLAGRLEIFPVLLLLSPRSWR